MAHRLLVIGASFLAHLIHTVIIRTQWMMTIVRLFGVASSRSDASTVVPNAARNTVGPGGGDAMPRYPSPSCSSIHAAIVMFQADEWGDDREAKGQQESWLVVLPASC